MKTARGGWLALAALCLLSGCSRPVHARDVRSLQLVQTLGFDWEEGGRVLSVSSGKSPEGEGAARLAARGQSIADAAEKLQDWSDREELFYAHARFAVVGEAAARAGLAPVLDWFQRGTQTRLRVPLFVVKGDSARALIMASEDPAYEITALLTSLAAEAERTGPAQCFTVLDTAQRLARSGTALCCAVRLGESGGNVSAPQAAPVLSAGYAVFRDGALAGWLEPEGAMGAGLLLDRAGEWIYTVPLGESAVSLLLQGGATALSMETASDGAPLLRAKLEYRAAVMESSRPLSLTPEVLGTLEDALALRLAAQAEEALAAAREMDADLLELGRLGGERQEPVSALPPGLRWELEVRARVERSFDTDNSAPLWGEEGG